MAYWYDDEPEYDYDEGEEPYNEDSDGEDDMIVKSYCGGSCAASSIENLGMCKNAEDAMEKFCKLELCKDTRYDVSGFNILAPFYVFIAGPEKPGYGHSKNWVKYGTEFAAFIKDNGLGDIATHPAKVNKKYHPDTQCQIWLWNPNQSKISNWWVDHSKKVKPVVNPTGKKLRPDNVVCSDICPRCNKNYGQHTGWNCGDGGYWPE